MKGIAVVKICFATGCLMQRVDGMDASTEQIVETAVMQTSL
jgi:hypothetical protein